ncbi:MAG: McrC family protein [Azoarcus sp.]|jgi:5-methylcytosine-specific restriction enzyme subunit McrC|nr:McrC family protein [Azoarcus sp.]
MRSCNKTYTITEYGGFVSGEARNGYKGLPKESFEALENFILTNNKTDNGTDAIELLSLSARQGVGKVITARNYVGVITMKDGTVIEILPKIAGENIGDEETKKIFINMLKTFKNVPKYFNLSNLRVDRLNLLEIFVKMFLDEVSILTKQGLKAAYTPIENNERFYKGKLLASQNIKYNLVRKERFFVRYDDFNINRPENRLIKSTLGFLLKKSSDSRNRQSAMRLLAFFDGAEYSGNYDTDFSKCSIDRSMTHYEKALSWCRVFLQGNSFTAFAGSKVALALLFPMEKVFESFVAAKFRKHVESDVILRTQDSKYSLFDKPSAFALRPDIVLEFGNHKVILDTKWKLLSDNAQNNEISQSDMYQMYAYSKKYGADRVVLLYPQTGATSQHDRSYVSDDNGDKVRVDVSFIDLRDADESIKNLITKFHTVTLGKDPGCPVCGSMVVVSKTT